MKHIKKYNESETFKSNRKEFSTSEREKLIVFYKYIFKELKHSNLENDIYFPYGDYNLYVKKGDIDNSYWMIDLVLDNKRPICMHVNTFKWDELGDIFNKANEFFKKFNLNVTYSRVIGDEYEYPTINFKWSDIMKSDLIYIFDSKKWD